jgi:hypothetical protein
VHPSLVLYKNLQEEQQVILLTEPLVRHSKPIKTIKKRKRVDKMPLFHDRRDGSLTEHNPNHMSNASIFPPTNSERRAQRSFAKKYLASAADMVGWHSSRMDSYEPKDPFTPQSVHSDNLSDSLDKLDEAHENARKAGLSQRKANKISSKYIRKGYSNRK